MDDYTIYQAKEQKRKEVQGHTELEGPVEHLQRSGNTGVELGRDVRIKCRCRSLIHVFSRYSFHAYLVPDSIPSYVNPCLKTSNTYHQEPESWSEEGRM